MSGSRSGTMCQITEVDVKLVCSRGHTLWYPRAHVRTCDMSVSGGDWAMPCGARVRPLTEAEEAAYELGGFAAVKEIVQPWRL